MIKRKILVTGANKGIGLALVRELARRADCQIIMAFRKGNNGVDEFNNLKKEFSKADIHYFLVDITKSEQRGQLVNYIKEQFQTLDILVNNAALGYDEPFEVPLRELAESYLGCNFISTVLLTQQLLPVLSQDAKVINVSSGIGSLDNHSQDRQTQLRNPNLTKEILFGFVDDYLKGCDNRELNGWCKSSYRMSKALLNSWSRFVLKKQLKGVQSVLVLSPGFCNTDMVKNSHNPSLVEAPKPKDPEQGIITLLYCIYQIPFNSESSGNFYYNSQLSNEIYESRAKK